MGKLNVRVGKRVGRFGKFFQSDDRGSHRSGWPGVILYQLAADTVCTDMRKGRGGTKQNLRFILGIVKDSLFVTLDDDVKTSIDELLGSAWC